MTQWTADSPARAHAPRRPDIQGLRAIAVTLVILEHVSGQPVGGFIGVDVFFVISGFLITGLLLREHATTGRISFADFYRRRVKRLMPAAVAVLLVGAAIAWQLYGTARAQDIGIDAIWSLFFAANWHLAWQQTDYFAAAGPVSPFQHFWSLSVEEQFYLVWPALVLLVLTAVAARTRSVERAPGSGVAAERSRRGVHRRRPVAALVWVVGGVTVLSFAWASWDSVADPSTAYFSTFDRAWELGVGALLAVCASLFDRIPARAGTITAWIGVVGIVASAFLVDDTASFPAPWAAMPVIATALVLIGGAAPDVSAPVVLTNPVSRYLGDISYSLYLWHFPVLVFTTTIVPDQAWATYPISIALAVLSYHLIEQPVLSSPWLAPRRVGAFRQRHWHEWWTHQSQRLGLLSLAGLCVTGLLAVAVSTVETRQTVPLQAERAVFDDDDEQAPEILDIGPAANALTAEVRKALTADTWPELSPAIDDPDISGGSHGYCSNAPSPRPLATCTFGASTASRTVVVVGDSTAAHEVDAFIALAEDPANDLRVISRAAFACPFIDLSVANDTASACATYKEQTFDVIRDVQPDLVVLTNSYSPFKVDGGQDVTPDAWTKAFRSYAERLAEFPTRVVHLTPPPGGKDVQECYRPGGSPSACITSSSGLWSMYFENVTRIGKDLDQTVVDIRSLICVDGACPAFAGTTPIKLDAVHFTGAFAQKMAPALMDLLHHDGILTS